MAAGQYDNAGEYIAHHLVNLTYARLPAGAELCYGGVAETTQWTFAGCAAEAEAMGFMAFHVDSLMWSFGLGTLVMGIFFLAARRASAEAPGKFQGFIEMVVEFVGNTTKEVFHGRTGAIAPIALTVFTWVFMMNLMKLVPVDLIPFPLELMGVEYQKIAATTDPNVTLGMATFVLMLMIGFSVAFGYMMALMQIPAKMTQFFMGISENKYVFLLLVNLLLLVLGTFMDLAPMLLICTPIFLPVILKLGIDPVHFGMIMILNLGIGLITPPVGPTLFVGCAVGKVSIEQVTKELWPFYGVMCLALLLVTYVPALSLWLPGLMK
jgi:TRAP-type C4-dicarboxylate transport system permease large subunit